ncbi:MULTISPECIES: UbiA family prenyltransferase [unclassified Janthinobacterium]|uniref:UbiA family prenyltransferase n=1 Tax=unclassified Janthinobacterium TaxID=2610881 RepID=UPI000AD4C55B|nr:MULTISPECIES: UbiA family prenyltransferase [unclassified Janthinobacterium]
MTSPPLVVDLDGTLILTDMLHESALQTFRDKPLDSLYMPYWLYKGKAILKQQLARRAKFDVNAIPYNLPLLDWLKQQKAAGRRLILCTASDRSFATAIANHLGIFDEVMASNGGDNLAGRNKAAALELRFGRAGFDYAGNSSADLAVWARARRAVVVNASAQLAGKAAAQCEVEREFPPAERGFSVWRRVLRVHQWMKNLLLFVPLFAAHEISDLDTWVALLFAFVAFSLCASTVYIANDLLDLESDREHPRKCKRPFAAGSVPVWMGVLLAPLLLSASVVLASFVGKAFLTWLFVYFVLTCLYSFGLKRLILVDCLTLAVLYTLRIIAGAAAAGHVLSFWLLAFSVFLFLSLAFVKRYAELQGQMLSGKTKVHGRGYFTSDAPLVQTLGIASGYAATVVLALYLNSDAVLVLYRLPEAVWGAVPVMLFWVSWVWIKAHRGEMHDDPLVFALKDKASLLAGLIFAIIMGIGTVGLP